ncbi:MAG: hypothetical protein KF799_05695 [Bdellovibrionales bacterium]|nr:hypothetical protein [Bdellovibrionales bacterium]
MKTRLFFLFLSVVMAACTPKNSPRYEHEGQKTWKPIVAPSDETVEVKAMADFPLAKAYDQLKNPNADLKASVLKPLSAFVLNAKFTQTPAHRTTRLAEMISVFNAAFLQQLYKNDQSPEFLQMKDEYYRTVFAGCSRDLRRDCATADLFSTQPRHARIFTLLAKELDGKIEAALKESGSAGECMRAEFTANGKTTTEGACRRLIEERYYRLAMAAYNNRAHYDETEFQFAYLKYARLFALFIQNDRTCRPQESAEICDQRLRKSEGRNPDTGAMSFSYLSETHRQIFQTVIAKYQPSNYNSPEFRAFVENFNPWTYTKKQADFFQNGASTMFEFGTKCCLYKDSSRQQLSEAVTDAIKESQASTDHFVATVGLSFRNMILEIKRQHNGNELFKNLGILELIQRIEDPNSGFYNEFFFVVDRLFRGHLTTAEVEKVLHNSNPKRMRTEFPTMVTDYMKIYIAYMVVETNRFMADIYNENLASDKVFEEAVIRSRALTGRWHEIQSQIGLVRQVMGSYFNGANLKAADMAVYYQADKTIKAVNRNIHYLSVFPNMIVMTYYLSKANGSINFTSWWGQKFEIQGGTVLKSLFNGEETSPWFHFGVDAERIDRLMLLYSLEYMLSTEALKSFVAKESGENANDRSAFFDLVFNKYLDDAVTVLREKITGFERETAGNPNLSLADEICRYELNPKAGMAPRVSIGFMDLSKYTYSGIGDWSVNSVLNNYLGAAGTSLRLLRDEIDSRRKYTKAMAQVIAKELVRTGKIKAENESHPDLARANAMLSELDKLQAHLATIFVSSHKKYFDCALTLQEIERRRTNRLYDEERAHLSQVFDLMKPLFEVNDGESVDSKANEINAAYFTPEKGYRFSRLTGRTYRLSKYDLLMRMKERISSDVFRTPTERERKAYDGRFPEYYRPRPVSVVIPEALERDDMVGRGLTAPIYMRGTSEADREDFIRQGIVLLNAKVGSFVEWQGQRSQDKGLEKYLEALQEVYLMGSVIGSDGKSYEVSKEDVVDAYVKITASYSMDALDQVNARDFGIEGRYPKAFFLDRIFQRDGQTVEPLFYFLMNSMNQLGVLNMKDAGPVKEALDFAKGFNSMQAFVFQPSNAVPTTVTAIYGQSAHLRLQRVADLFSYIHQLEQTVGDATRLDARLAQPFYIENGSAYLWYRGRGNLVDYQKVTDIRILIEQFTQQTGNLYKTQEKVKVP